MSNELRMRLTESDYANLMVFENNNVNNTSSENDKKYQKKTKANFLNKLFFWWSKKAMEISNKKILTVNHLAKNQENLIDFLFNKITNEYYKRIGFNNPKENFNNLSPHNYMKKKSLCPLFFSILISNIKELLIITLLSLLIVLCKYLQIKFLRILIIIFSTIEKEDPNSEFGEKKNNNDLKNKIYLYAFLFLINKLTLIFLQNHSIYLCEMLGYDSGNMLSALIYDKILNSSLVVSGDTSEGQMINFLQVDIDTLGFLFFFAPMTLVVPTQLIIYFYMLFEYFGKTLIFGILLFLFMFILAWVIQKFYIKNQRILSQNKDKRMKITSDVLHMLKVLKLYVWEDEFINRIEKVRDEELISMKKIQNVYLLSRFIHSTIPLFLSIASIGVYSLINGRMPLENLLASIEIFESMSEPLYRLPIFITSLLNCLISMSRLETFLNTKNYKKVNKEDFSLKQKNIDIKLLNCYFGVTNPETYTNKILLQNLNIEIKKGELVAVLGETGSGKTCFINSLLNYLDFFPKIKNNENEIFNIINGKISYAPQNPWILNGTIRENIIFYNEFNKERYKKVLDICQLINDLELLPGGELTEISSNGTNVSGGQKARISLARAIYKNADIYLFDDPILSVDPINSEQIFKNALLGYLKNKTRILVKHEMKNIDLFNKIIYIKKGKIMFCGNFEELTKSEVYNILKAEYIDQKLQQNLTKNNIIINEKKLSYRERTISFGHENEKRMKGRLIKDEELNEDSINKKLYISLIILMGGIIFFFLIIIISASIQIASVLGNIWIIQWASGKHKSNLNSFLIYAEIGLLSCFLLFLKEFIFSRGLLKINKTLHNKMLYKIIHAPINLFHDIVPIGQIISRLTSDLDKCRVINKLLNLILRSIFILITSIYVCFKYNTYSLISVPVMIIIGTSLTNYYISAGRNLNRLDGISRAPIITCFSETLSGIKIIKSFNKEFNLKNRLFNFLNEYYYVVKYKIGVSVWYSLFLQLGSYLYILFIILSSTIFYKFFNAEAIALLIKYSISFSDELLNTFNYLSEIEKNMVSYERCDEYTKIIQENNKQNLQQGNLLLNWPNEGKVIIENYSCRYRPETELVIKNLNANINGGEKIGIVGKSGSGKSTLLLSLFRIVEPLHGKIIIDGINIANISLKNLREKMCIVPQEPTLFEGTIRDNVDPLKKYNDEEIFNILKELEFFDIIKNNKCEDKNELINKYLSFKIKESGINVSLGKKQLLCFARAILKNSKIIVLDEATAALDQKTEDIIQKAIDTYFKNCTVFSIAHRIECVLDFDRIMVFDEGELKEFDNPKKLLSQKNSLFSQLYNKEMNEE